MKKFLFLICPLILSLSISTFAFSDINNHNTKAAVELLQKYSILDGYPDGTFKPTNPITRAEFSKIVVTAGDLFLLIDNDISFQDTKNHWAEEYICLAKYFGIVNGISAEKFAPNANVTYEQALKMIVCLLGYENEAAKQGGYPTGYIKVASSLGVLKNIDLIESDYSKPATREDIANMIYNSLDIECIIMDLEGNRLEQTDETLTLRGIQEDRLERNAENQSADDDYFDYDDPNDVEVDTQTSDETASSSEIEETILDASELESVG